MFSHIQKKTGTRVELQPFPFIIFNLIDTIQKNEWYIEYFFIETMMDSIFLLLCKKNENYIQQIIKK